ncbi:MAG: phenylalanine--tRNA ligase subunit alpha [Planctomycetota bacterium]
MPELEGAVESIRKEAGEALSAASDASGLEAVRVRYLGRKGRVRELMQMLASLPAEERPRAGQIINTLKNELTRLHDRRKSELGKGSKGGGGLGEAFDVTLPGQRPRIGKIHPLTRAMREIVDIFARMGFSAVYGPEIETVHHNYECLNMPRDHPSRDAFDTFFIKGRPDLVLRSHTSPVQIRAMLATEPPLRIVVPGRTYRPDTVDATHSFMFSQVEGLMVDTDVSMADLKFCLDSFAKAYFGPTVSTRFRPHYFPFTEPSAEMDVSCIFCDGKGCRICGAGWIEVLGCGMVHPNVFRAVDYDPERYTGFAFGMGVERLCMLKHQVTDLRLFFENDVRFLDQF